MGDSGSMTSPIGVWRGWRQRLGARPVLGVGYAVAALLTFAAVYVSTRAPGPGPTGPTSRTILAVVLANLVLILALAASVGWRVVHILRARSRDAGARLQLRFMTTFALAAVLPAIVVALFFGALVTRGVENWFSSRVRTVVENSAKVAESYFREQNIAFQADLRAMVSDLDQAAPEVQSSPSTFNRMLQGQAQIRQFSAVYVIDRQGQILAGVQASDAPSFAAPQASDFPHPDEDAVVKPVVEASLIRGVSRLKALPGDYLYVVRRVQPGIFQNLTATSGALKDYRDAAANRQQIQAAFMLTYLETVLLVVVGAVWLGIGAANAISAPVARLVAAADRISGGDLTARVEAHSDPEEIAVLSRAFNRMTSDLQAQQMALRAASLEAESRREFIETVLAGVSAGVLSLDGAGRISAANQQAHVLLRLPPEALGKPLAEAAPELQDLADAAGRTGGEAETELDLVRSGETRRLRVRASGASEGGLVLTFDDITRLVTAQRSAAWRDVARRIAHEIKNPLTPIQLSAERLQRKYRKEITTDPETFDRCTETIVRQVGDIRQMVDEFSAFARMPAPKFERQDARELLRQAVFAQRVADPDAAIELEDPGGEVALMCDGRMVGQALTNILKNAGEAIAARRQSSPRLKGRITARLVSDQHGLAFEIEDNGVGLPPSGREKLTEPYVTTREKGTGLGLAIVKRIMEEHGGEILLQDAAKPPGARTVLHFLPASSIEPAAPQGASTAA
jgi:two-component system nitrogen regulation sensor histidine kinase NtrY